MDFRGRDILVECGYLAEAVLVEVRLRRYQTVVDLVFNNVRTRSSDVRANLEEPDYVTLTFSSVRELTIKNGLTAAQLANPELLNWGINEIACVEIGDGAIRPPSGDSEAVRHATVLWEGDRRIDIAFSDLEVVRGRRSPNESSQVPDG